MKIDPNAVETAPFDLDKALGWIADTAYEASSYIPCAGQQDDLWKIYRMAQAALGQPVEEQDA